MKGNRAPMGRMLPLERKERHESVADITAALATSSPVFGRRRAEEEGEQVLLILSGRTRGIFQAHYPQGHARVMHGGAMRRAMRPLTQRSTS
ncbi:unnamed protein product [Lota lota]